MGIIAWIVVGLGAGLLANTLIPGDADHAGQAVPAGSRTAEQPGRCSQTDGRAGAQPHRIRISRNRRGGGHGLPAPVSYLDPWSTS
jgi:hypothetical protein